MKKYSTFDELKSIKEKKKGKKTSQKEIERRHNEVEKFIEEIRKNIK